MIHYKKQSEPSLLSVQREERKRKLSIEHHFMSASPGICKHARTVKGPGSKRMIDMSKQEVAIDG